MANRPMRRNFLTAKHLSEIHISLWKNPYKFLPRYFFASKNPYLLHARKAAMLAHSLFVGKDQPRAYRSFDDRKNRTASLFLISPMFFVSVTTSSRLSHRPEKNIPATKNHTSEDGGFGVGTTIRAKVGATRYSSAPVWTSRCKPIKNDATLWLSFHRSKCESRLFTGQIGAIGFDRKRQN